MKRSELTKYIKEEIIDALNEATPEEVEAQKELNKELEKTVKLSKEAGLKEEFTEFKTYDDIIGGLIIRADAMKKFLSQNEPDLLPLADQLEAIITDLDNKIGDIDYANVNEVNEDDDNDDDAYQLAKAAKGKSKKYDLALKGFKEVETRMKSLARKYTEAEGEDKEKIKAELKKLTGQKAELKSLVDKYADDLV